MSIGLKVSGDWKDVSAVSVKVSGAWKTVSQAYVKVSGTWEELLSSAAAVLAWIANTTDTGNRTTYTFASQSFGAAESTRRVIVAGTVRSNAARTISSISIGGVAATIVAQQTESTALLRSFIAIAHVPTGTTGSVVVTMNSGCIAMRIAVWSVTGLASDTPTATATDNNVNDPSANITIPANGFVVGVATNTNSSTGSWSSGLTLQGTAEYVESDHNVIFGDASSAPGASITATAAFAGTNTRGILVVAAFA